MSTRTTSTIAAGKRLPLSILLTLGLCVSWPLPARASFHLIEVNKILPSFNGNANIQALELRMLSSGENLVTGMAVRTYNATGGLVGTLGTFAADLPAAGALTDRKILCATTQFQTTFGITADLTITPGIISGTGQISWEKPGCFVNSVAYGDVTVPKTGTTTAVPIPTGLAYALVRTASNAISPSCPLAENSGARFVVRSGSAASPIPFSNNANVTVNVFSTMTGVEAETPTARPLRASPNPFARTTEIEVAGPASRVVIHDVRGRVVREWNATGSGTGNTRRFAWDGTDARGLAVASGIYFVRVLGGATAVPPLRIVRMR